MIKTIIFDIGNVLAEYNWKAYLDTFPYPAETKKLLADVLFLSPEWNEFDRGRSLMNSWLKCLSRKHLNMSKNLKKC